MNRKAWASAAKHLSLLRALFSASAIADLEYRANVALKVATDVVWYVAQLSVFEVLFKHAPRVSGWTAESTRVFMGALFVVDALYMLFFSQNLDRLSDKVRKGELDLLLAKPVNSQFMLSFQRVSVAYLINLAIATGWLAFAIEGLPEKPSVDRYAFLLVGIACGLAITYSLRFFFSATAMIFDRAENVNYVWYQLYRLGTRPDGVYPPWLRFAVLSLVPVGFIASVPSRMILESPNFALLGGAIALAIALLWFSAKYWSFGLRRYSSASS